MKVVNVGINYDLYDDSLKTYDKLPAGTYRICKDFMDFRGAGDYDEALFYAEFEIK